MASLIRQLWRKNILKKKKRIKWRRNPIIPQAQYKLRGINLPEIARGYIGGIMTLDLARRSVM